jgi:hypothetical protein
MVDQLSDLNFREDYERALALPEAERWALDNPAPLEVRATMSPASAPTEKFEVRLLWKVYPDDLPPSLKFRDPETGRLDLASAWPKIPGYRPTSFDTCVNYSAEGFGLHPEWKNDPRYRWRAVGNVLLKMLRLLQDEFDNSYQGRHQ